MIGELKDGPAPLPGLFLCLLWIVFAADGDVGLALDPGDLAVMALGSFWNTSDRILNLSGYGIVTFPAAVPGTIKMGFEFTNAPGQGRDWNGHRFPCQPTHIQIRSYSSSAKEPEPAAVLVPFPETTVALPQHLSQPSPAKEPQLRFLCR